MDTEHTFCFAMSSSLCQAAATLQVCWTFSDTQSSTTFIRSSVRDLFCPTAVRLNHQNTKSYLKLATQPQKQTHGSADLAQSKDHIGLRSEGSANYVEMRNNLQETST